MRDIKTASSVCRDKIKGQQGSQEVVGEVVVLGFLCNQALLYWYKYFGATGNIMCNITIKMLRTIVFKPPIDERRIPVKFEFKN